MADLPEAEIDDERLPFGELAVLEEMITREQLGALLAQQLHSSKRMKIGTLLVREGYLSKKQGKRILRIQKSHGPIEGYQLLEHLGSGGMGSVFRALREETGQEVAVKILPPRATRDSRYRTRFLREAKLLKELDHENLVRCYDQGESNDHLYYAMELVPGRTGRAMLKTEGMAYEEDLRSFLRQMLGAMDHYWGQRIVHRDIKPENIMFTPDGVVKLTDLGLSRQLDDGVHITRVGKTLGTPLYISPELAQGRSDIDIRSDLYSLGGTFFHLACGVPPFFASSQAELLKMHVEDPAPLPRDKNPDLSEGFEALLLKLLEKEPEDRFQDPAAVLEALDRLERGEAPLKPTRRRPTPPQPSHVRRRGGLGSSSMRASWQPKQAPRKGRELTPLFVLVGFSGLFALGVLLGSKSRPSAAAQQQPTVIGAVGGPELALARFQALLDQDMLAGAQEALAYAGTHDDDLPGAIARLESVQRRMPATEPLRKPVDAALESARRRLDAQALSALDDLRSELIDLVDAARYDDARAKLEGFSQTFRQVPSVGEAHAELVRELELAASDGGAPDPE